MNIIENLNKEEGIEKLKKIVEEIKFCFFKTSSKNDSIDSATIMTAQSVDSEGNIWFFSGIDSDRNNDIKTNKKIQLYFSCPEKNAYLSVNADASIVLDKNKIKEFWNPLLKIWFENGIDDKNISLIKATTISANYWDSENGKMINFFKMISDAITGENTTNATYGKIKL
jgi:general stress protein 26